MGYIVTGTLFFREPLTVEQARELRRFMCADSSPSGVEDWVLAAGRVGLVYRWEEAGKTYYTHEGLVAVLEELRKMGVGWEGGQWLRRIDPDNVADAEDWHVEEDSAEVRVSEEQPLLVYQVSRFVEGLVARIEAEGKAGGDVARAAHEYIEAWENEEPLTAQVEDEDEYTEEEE